MKVSRVTPTKRLELERDLYGTTHAEVGAYLLSIWGFSHRIVGAVLHHHNPAIMDEKNFDTTTVVHIAESLMSGTDNCLDEAHIERLGKATAFLFGERPQPKLSRTELFHDCTRDRLTGRRRRGR